MKFNRSLLLFPLFATACSSAPKGGNGEVDSIYPTTLSSPARIEDTKVADVKYAKDWVGSVGGGYDDFKRVTIPAYTIEFITSVKDVNQNKMAAMFDKSDGGKNILDMQVVLPVDAHVNLLREITNESYARLKGKFAKLGLEVVDWADIKAKSENAREFEQDKLDMTPVQNKGGSLSVAADGLGRLNSIFWNYSAASTSRNAEVVVVIPHFTVGFGYFGGEPTPQTVTEAHGPAKLQFTPQVQIYSGSGLKTSGKYEGGALSLGKSAVTDRAYATKLEKFGDTLAAAKEHEENARRLAAANHGTTTENIQGISSRAGTGYEVKMDPAKFKAAVLEQLNLVEDLVIARYKNEL